MQSGAKTKRPWLQGKLEDEDSKALFGRKLAPKGRSKDVFVNMLTIDFNPSLADVIKIEKAASRFLSCGSTLDDSVWDQHDDRHSTNIPLSFLLDSILEVPQTKEGCNSLWIIPSEVTNNLFGNAKSWNFDKNANAIFLPIKPIQEDWILCDRETPLSCLSSVPTNDLINPQL